MLREKGTIREDEAEAVTRMTVLNTITKMLVGLRFPVPFLTPSFCRLSFSRMPIVMKAFTVKPITNVLVRLIGVLMRLIAGKAVATNINSITGFLFKYTCIMPTNLVCHFHRGGDEMRTITNVTTKAILATVLTYFIGTFILLPTCNGTFKVPVRAFVRVKDTMRDSMGKLLAFTLLVVTPFGVFGCTLASLVIFMVCGGVHIMLGNS